MDEQDAVEELTQPEGPPVSSMTTEKEVPTITLGTMASNPLGVQDERAVGPPVPEGGLPAGWSEEQWQYYGQQYLDGTL